MAFSENSLETHCNSLEISRSQKEMIKNSRRTPKSKKIQDTTSYAERQKTQGYTRTFSFQNVLPRTARAHKQIKQRDFPVGWAKLPPTKLRYCVRGAISLTYVMGLNPLTSGLRHPQLSPLTSPLWWLILPSGGPLQLEAARSSIN